jgi:hypothetical protein
MLNNDFIEFNSYKLEYDIIWENESKTLIIIHWAWKWNKARYKKIREELKKCWIKTIAIDMIWHWNSQWKLENSSLEIRTNQILKLIDKLHIKEPLNILGTSMWAYNAIKISEIKNINLMILGVPWIYINDAYKINFWEDFSKIIRQDKSWEKTDSWEILKKYNNKILIFASDIDHVIPTKIPENLYKYSSNSEKRKLIWLKNYPHSFTAKMNEDKEWMNLLISNIKNMI